MHSRPLFASTSCAKRRLNFEPNFQKKKFIIKQWTPLCFGASKTKKFIECSKASFTASWKVLLQYYSYEFHTSLIKMCLATHQTFFGGEHSRKKDSNAILKCYERNFFSAKFPSRLLKSLPLFGPDESISKHLLLEGEYDHLRSFEVSHAGIESSTLFDWGVGEKRWSILTDFLLHHDSLQIGGKAI